MKPEDEERLDGQQLFREAVESFDQRTLHLLDGLYFLEDPQVLRHRLLDICVELRKVRRRVDLLEAILRGSESSADDPPPAPPPP